jgi:2,2-dialkylglycine decarboxylase (pyruvate)
MEFAALGRGQKHSARALSDAVTDNALKLGLSANIVRAGASEGVMRIAPPLTATEAEIDLGLELLGAALEQTLGAAGYRATARSMTGATAAATASR